MTSRNEIREELVDAGYSVRWLDEWPDKTILYRHKPQYNVEGKLVFDVGTTLDGVPGTPEYVLRKARLGFYNVPPSENHGCRWCKERAASKPTRDDNGKFVKKQADV